VVLRQVLRLGCDELCGGRDPAPSSSLASGDDASHTLHEKLGVALRDGHQISREYMTSASLQSVSEYDRLISTRLFVPQSSRGRRSWFVNGRLLSVEQLPAAISVDPRANNVKRARGARLVLGDHHACIAKHEHLE
jgi:hypothetical protein